MSDEKRLSDGDLHAYLDDNLDQPRRAEIDAILATDDDAAERLRAYRAQKAALHATYDPVLAEALPERLGEPALTRGRVTTLAIGRRVAAALALLVVGGVGGWFANDELCGDAILERASLAADAVVAHRVFQVEVRHPVEVPASEGAHLVAWLSKRLEAPLATPELLAQGYNLVGGRLLAAGGGPAAQFMYEDTAGQRLTLYVRGNAGGSETSFRFVADGDISGFYWLDDRLGYALIGPLEREALLPLVRIVYEQLNP